MMRFIVAAIALTMVSLGCSKDEAPQPAAPNPYTVNLLRNVQRLQLDVAQIAALHGPRVTTLADLRAAAGVPATTAQR